MLFLVEIILRLFLIDMVEKAEHLMLLALSKVCVMLRNIKKALAKTQALYLLRHVRIISIDL